MNQPSIDFTFPFERRSEADRRRADRPLWSRCRLMGRRAGSRRAEDRKRFFKVDRYSGTLLSLVLLTLLMSVSDAGFTLYLISRGASELNPVMAFFLERGPLVFFVVKYVLTCGSLLIVILYKNAFIFNTRIRVAYLLVLFLALFALVVQWELFLVWLAR
jgi:hypothetical protein